MNERTIEAATEEGFTGPKEDWFDGKLLSDFYYQHSEIKLLRKLKRVFRFRC